MQVAVQLSLAKHSKKNNYGRQSGLTTEPVTNLSSVFLTRINSMSLGGTKSGLQYRNSLKSRKIGDLLPEIVLLNLLL